MSRILPDPQIVQLRAMRAGDIAIALPSPATATVGVAPLAAASPLVLPMITVTPAAPSQGTIDGTPSDTAGPVGESFATTLTQDVLISVGLSGAGSFPEIFFTLVTLDGTPEIDLITGGTHPALTVTHGTSVV